jgi:serine/threonine protein kinase
MAAQSAVCPTCQATLTREVPASTETAICQNCGERVQFPTTTGLGNVDQTSSLAPTPAEVTISIAVSRSRDENGNARAAFGSHQSSDYPFLSRPQQPDEIGRLGSYRVLGVLGTGGMGVVFRAEDPALRRQIALKIMLPEFASNHVAKARFLREARAQAAIDHDHIIAIYKVGGESDIPYIAMPLLKGQTLAAALKSNPALPIGEAVRIALEMAEGLAAAHEQNLVHRDIKPANVWLEGEQRRVKILDFGLARAESGDDGVEPVTQQGAIIGTPAYMSPEQATGDSLDARTDLFSLGAVLYQMLTGHRPFVGKNMPAVLMAVVSHTPVPPSELNPDVPADLDALTMRLLAKSATDRPATAEIAAEELRAVESRLFRTEPADEPWGDEANEPSTRERGQRRSRVPIAVALGALAVAAAAYAINMNRSSPERKTPESAKVDVSDNKGSPPRGTPRTETAPPKEKVWSKEVYEPAGDGWIDLLALDATRADPPSGQDWARTPDGWTSTYIHNGFSPIGLSVTATGGYDVEAEVSLKKGIDAIGFRLPIGDSMGQFGFNNYSGTLAGFHLVDGKFLRLDENPTRTRQPQPLKIGERVKVAISVRVNGDLAEVTANVDGIPPVRWSGRPSQLSLGWTWKAPNDRLGVSTCWSQYTVHSLRFKRFDGKAYVIKRVLVKEVCEPVGGDWVDLLALGDTWAVMGQAYDWHFTNGKWVSTIVPGDFCQLGLPLTATGGYDLEAEVTLEKPGEAISFRLPVGDSSVQFGVNHYEGAVAGFHIVNGNELRSDGNPTRTPHESLKIGERIKLAISVRINGDQAELSATVDGIKPIRWTGRLSQLGLDWFWQPPNDRLGVMAHRSQYTVNSLRFKKVSGKAEIIKLAPMKEVREAIGKDWVDVLALDESWTDTWSGTGWNKKAGKWTSTFVPNGPSLVRMPLSATGGYDLEAEVTLDAGDSALSILFQVGERCVGLGLNGRGFAGLQWIGDMETTSAGNPTRTPHDPFKIGQRIKIVISVRVNGDQAELSATVDGISPIRWTGPVSALSHSWATDRLTLATWASRYTVHALRFKKIDGKAEIIKRMALASK